MKMKRMWRRKLAPNPRFPDRRPGREFVIFDGCEDPPRYHIRYLDDGSERSVPKDAIHLWTEESWPS
jgi:hypothetical protein